MQAEELKEAEEAQHLQLAQHRVRRQYQHQHHTRYQYRASPSTRVGSQRILPWCPPHVRRGQAEAGGGAGADYPMRSETKLPLRYMLRMVGRSLTNSQCGVPTADTTQPGLSARAREKAVRGRGDAGEEEGSRRGYGGGRREAEKEEEDLWVVSRSE
eukprot:776876-Rhodomonas_salina.6